MGLESAGGLTAAYDRLHENPEITGEGIELALEFECQAMEAGAKPDWSRERLHRFESGKKGGLTTLARYGREYYRALARVRWGHAPKETLPALRETLVTLPEEPRQLPHTPQTGSTERIAA